jgi:hypothetical protein
MKFMLLITLCSLEYQACMPPIEGGFFKSLHDCAKDGYEKSLGIVKNIEPELFNENKYIIKFRCGELEDDQI